MVISIDPQHSVSSGDPYNEAASKRNEQEFEDIEDDESDLWADPSNE